MTLFFQPKLETFDSVTPIATPRVGQAKRYGTRRTETQGSGVAQGTGIRRQAIVIEQRCKLVQLRLAEIAVLIECRSERRRHGVAFLRRIAPILARSDGAKRTLRGSLSASSRQRYSVSCQVSVP